MRSPAFALSFLVFLTSSSTFAQREADSSKSASIVVKAGRVLDARKGSYVENAAIWIEGERIKEVGAASQVLAHVPKNAETIDLGRATVLPGLIDCHTHLMARFASTPDGYVLGLATKSQAFRALEGAANARLTLHAGFTTVRDVESEGSEYADVALRDAIKQGLVEGPRMRVATRAIAAVGQYNPFGVSPDLRMFPTGAQMISGAEEARRAVREQVGHGADLIKVYADWNYPTLTVEEMRVIAEEAHKAGRKVAAHAMTTEGIKNAVTAGVDSIEHGHGADRRAIEMIKEKDIYLVPTVGVIDEFVERQTNDPANPERRQFMSKRLERMQQMIQLAVSLGVKIASGFDASEEGLHGKNAQELVSLVKRGVPSQDAIRAATVNAADLLGWQNDVGAVEAGKYADLIGVEGDPLTDISVLTQVNFVMKGGRVVRDTLHR
jgi:imidazolonepropionase-like amidohydrolase